MSHFIEETKREISMARCHNRRIPMYLKELCIRYYSETRRELHCNFQVEKACN
jgi:hypothetical protein